MIDTLGLLLLGGTGLLAALSYLAPVGWEDEDGFHYGEEP